MNDTMIAQEYLKAEVAYRRDRIRREIAGSRLRRSATRRAAGESTFGSVR